MNLKASGWIGVAIVAALCAGWLWGASGRSATEQQRRQLEERLDFSEAHAALADGRVSLYLVNFGDANRHFDDALRVVQRVQTRLREVGQPERAGRLEVVLAQVREAQRLSAALDQGAQSAADQALQALRSVEK